MTSTGPCPDLDLDRLRGRHPEAVAAWFDTYADPVYGFILYRVGRDQELAAEIAQETFTTALDRVESFDPDRGEMLPWLTYIARNVIRKAQRHNARHCQGLDQWQRLDSRLAAALANLETAPLADEILERKETADMVRAALSELPLRYQRALRQRYFMQLSVREIAALEEATEGAIKVLLHRARRVFQTAFERLAEDLAEVPDRREMP
jgi:RNA polymerase sigma-70 factor (ECF subfamily)